MWELYDIFLDNMDESETMADFLTGPRWAAVQSSSGSVGVAPVIHEQRDRFEFSYRPVKGMPLKEMAAHLKFWNFLEASLALAAVNACYNVPGSDESSPPHRKLPGGRRVRKSFQAFCEEHTTEGLTILAEPLYDQNELSQLPGRKMVLRQDPESGDYLYTAGTALIPEADRLILSGGSLVNKTAGILYEHAKRSGVPVFLFGPEIPLCPALLPSGIRGLWGLVIDQPEELMQLARSQLSRDTLLRTGHFEVLEWKEGAL